MSLQDKINNAKETPWIGYYRPKEQIVYILGIQGTASISCHPRSKWLCISSDEHYTVLQNRNVTICITTKDFKSKWVEWNAPRKGTEG